MFARDGEGPIGKDAPGIGDVYSKVQENLELPYIYENTEAYNGSINPEQTITFELPKKDSEDTQMIKPEVSDDGRFTLPLFNVDWEFGNELYMYINGGMPHERPFELPIQPEEEGMEIVPRKTDAIKEIEEATQFSKFYVNTTTYSGETVSDAHVQVSKKGTGENMELEVDDNDEFSGNFNDFPEEDTNLEEEDTLLFIITNKQGYATYFNVDVLSGNTDTVNEIEEKTYLPDFYENTGTYYGKTMPGSDVQVVAKEAGDKMDMEVNEKGNFTGFFSNFPYRAKEEPTLLEDDTLVFTITNDEVSYSADFEVGVLPKSDDPNYTEPVSPNDE